MLSFTSFHFHEAAVVHGGGGGGGGGDGEPCRHSLPGAAPADTVLRSWLIVSAPVPGLPSVAAGEPQ